MNRIINEIFNHQKKSSNSTKKVHEFTRKSYPLCVYLDSSKYPTVQEEFILNEQKNQRRDEWILHSCRLIRVFF